MIFLPAVLFGKAGGDVRHALLVAALPHPEVAGILFQRLADTEHVAVPEDSHHALHEGRLLAVHRQILLIEEADQRLRHGHAFGLHEASRQPSVGMENAAPRSCCRSGQRAVRVFIRV